MRLSSTPSTYILLPFIAIMWPPKSVASASAEAWITILDRIPGQMHVLTHAIELDALDIHLAPVHRHNVAAKECRVCVSRSLDHDIRSDTWPDACSDPCD